ncbi:hypothetical protein Bca101_010232 [Brassica carinata]
MSYRLWVSKGYMPELPGSKRVNSTTSEFLGDEAHKPQCFKRTNHRIYKLQEDISIIIGFRDRPGFEWLHRKKHVQSQQHPTSNRHRERSNSSGQSAMPR